MYTALSPNDPLATKLEALVKYEPFLNKFCLILNTRAIQAVVHTALHIKTKADTGIF
jgi:hypothetical protein